MNDCIFCKIIAGDIPSKKIYEDDTVFAFYDIKPEAPVHFLVVPKTHIASAGDITPGNCGIAGHIFSVISKLAEELRLTDGFRVVTNIGKQGGQTVEHLHFHVLSGRDMTWPPG